MNENSNLYIHSIIHMHFFRFVFAIGFSNAHCDWCVQSGECVILSRKLLRLLFVEGDTLQILKFKGLELLELVKEGTFHKAFP